MIRELAHFVRYGPAVGRRQAALGPAAFLDWLSAEIDATELGTLRRRLTEGLNGRVLEVGAGTGTLFARYAPDTQVTAIEPDAGFRIAATVTACKLFHPAVPTAFPWRLVQAVSPPRPAGPPRAC